ncbi:diguanylate cyclase domain-containing protein [Tissierella sp.]|uniref:diguanylate cyclase domain-containing protein n=1 Tax=Tissierella sp. TaxID=41274 RepID=UPI0028659E77|nr:diguanylate cyclase [Tissierella sp.]MDR7857458.1 diguanylate cyclase [Tissierella sp.]
MKMKYRLMLTYGLLVALSFIIVLGNLLIFRTMESDSSFVNYSGKLRATSYKMAQLSNVIINEKDKIIKDELEKSIQYFDSLLTSLYDGNPTLGMSKLTHKATIEKMEHIKTLWDTRYKIAYSSILKDEDTSSLRIINEEVGIYVDFIDKMVTSYSENARLKVTRSKSINGFISIITIVAAFLSFNFINNGIRKPFDLLMKNLKELSFADADLAKKIEAISNNEIGVMEGYFNELIYDSLTRVYNRRSGLSKLNRMFQYDDRRQFTISLCFIDINGLKQVNDVLGHKYGDELIVSSVDIIKNSIREHDFIIRLGGDEFLVVFNGINENTAETVWSRIVQAYDKINREEGRPYLISVSHGIVEYNNKQKSELDNLIKEADEKMYLEKRKIKEELKINVIR